MVDLLGIISLILAMALLFITVGFSVSKYLVHRSAFNLEFIFLSTIPAIWVISGIVHLLYSEIDISDWRTIMNWVFLGLIYLYLRLSYIFSKFIFSEVVKNTSQIAIIGLSILAGLRIADMVLPGPNQLFANPTSPSGYPIVTVFILIAHMSNTILFFEANYYIEGKFNSTFSDKLKQLTNYTLAWSFVAVFAVGIYVILSFSDPILSFEYLSVLRLIIAISVSLLIHYVQDSPPVQLTNKVNIHQLIHSGYLGYSLVAVRDSGPEVLSSSSPFDLNYDFDISAQMLFASAALTVIGVGDSFKESIFSVPVPKVRNVVSLSFSFAHPDPELQDTRMKGVAPVVYSLLLPKNYSPLLTMKFELLSYVLKEVNEVTQIQDLKQSKFLCNLTESLFQQLF